MRKPSDALIVALDGTLDEALEWADACRGIAGWVKIGMTLFYAEGPLIIKPFLDRGFKVFLDLKLYDIPHQVEGAAYALSKLGVDMFTIHASGGMEMMRAARRGALRAAETLEKPMPTILGVTVLTSMDDEVLAQTGVTCTAQERVVTLTDLGWPIIEGIVCSPLEIKTVRKTVPADVKIVTPGVRPTWASTDDQARVMTPYEAISDGADYLVVGRPITANRNPKNAAQEVLSEITQALENKRK
ncbi:MAG: orotidine-5'-phosphate decarboxylase [Actinomycetia bacterium]|nr:orotidine-5'-phosphate decarboxylase [Actinomycetes bacterium]